MKRTGMKTATSEIVIERIVKPISLPPLSAAVRASSPPSIRRTMFSSMTIASSTTKPTESVSAMSERLSSEKFRSDIAANVPTIEAGTARLGMSVARTFRRNRKITRTTSAIVRTSVNSTSWTDSRIGTERSKRTSSLSAPGSCALSDGSFALTASTTAIVFEPGWRWIASVTTCLSSYQFPIRSFSTPSTTFPRSSERHGRAVAVRDDHRAVGRGVEELAVRLHREGLVDARRASRRAGSSSAAGSTVATSSIPIPRAASCDGSSFARTANFCAPVTCTCATPRDRREALRDERLGDLVHRRELHRGRREDEVEDGLVGRVDLLERRRGRHPGRELARGRGDRRLDVLRGRVDVAVERELERDLRRPLRARRVDRVEARDRRELPLEGRRDRGRHRLGARARKARRHLDRREVDVREVAHGERAEADRPEQEDPRHDERRHDGPSDEGLGDAHPLVLFSAFISTFAPGKSRSWPSVTTRSPAARPFVMATTPSDAGARSSRAAARPSCRP